MTCVEQPRFNREFSKISLVRNARFNDGEGLLEELNANRNQGHYVVIASGYEALIRGPASSIRLLSREATHK